MTDVGWALADTGCTPEDIGTTTATGAPPTCGSNDIFLMADDAVEVASKPKSFRKGDGGTEESPVRDVSGGEDTTVALLESDKLRFDWRFSASPPVVRC